ncbi:MAG: arsenate reductase ArsC, partial [Anaerolineaceae bacterium]
RSQLAEAIVNARLGTQWTAFSAGTHPTGTIHPNTIQVLNEIGVHDVGHSKSVEAFRKHQFDLVVTVCDSAAEECPVWLGSGKILHYDFPDPAITNDINDFRKVRDDIEQVIIPLLHNNEF